MTVEKGFGQGGFAVIDEIQVENVALIRNASFAPSTGLTVITGETGAGKTALLAALKLLMGARAAADMVRDGQAELVVSGRFWGLSPANAMSEDGAEENADEVIAIRRVGADGRSRATLNGTMASMHELADAIAPSIDLCGQFEHQQLMKPQNHQGLLDAWAADDISEPLVAYQGALAQARQAADERARVSEAQTMSAALLDDARFTLKRIGEVNPEPGEYESIKHELEISEHAEALATSVATAHEALSGDGGSIDALGAAIGALETASRLDDSLNPLAESLREAGYILEDIAATTRDYRDSIEFDPAYLTHQQERFSQIQGLLRAYGPTMDDVFARRDEAAETVSLVDDSAERLRLAEAAVEQAERVLRDAADALDAARAEAAPRFIEAVEATMRQLEMGDAHLVCHQERLSREAWTKVGPSSFEFMYSPVASARPRPFSRIASGGEVSRVMLAIKVALGAHDDVDTLVFDEVDTGVGGATAVALAEVIAELARTHQVLVVTHLAQVAVKGDTHYVVRRVTDETGTESELVKLDDDARVAEIARMLSGDATEASLAHARELLG